MVKLGEIPTGGGPGLASKKEGSLCICIYSHTVQLIRGSLIMGMKDLMVLHVTRKVIDRFYLADNALRDVARWTAEFPRSVEGSWAPSTNSEPYV